MMEVLRYNQEDNITQEIKDCISTMKI
jgi:hypothetical protein